MPTTQIPPKTYSAKRRVCFIITSFIHYSRNLLILEELNKRSDVELHVVLGSSALLDKYSSRRAHVKDMLEKDGLQNIHEVYFNVEGDRVSAKAKTSGLGVIEFSSLFERISPDIVLVRGDRFETLSAALAASLMNISLAHIEGGDISGTIDESIRHAITKLSQIHFATNERAKERIKRMGEDPNYVFNFGSPDIEVTKKFADGFRPPFDVEETGSGASIDPNKKYIIVGYHPVTTEIEHLSDNTKAVLGAVHEMGIPTFWFWPNFDAGAEEKIAHELRIFNDQVKDHKIRFMRYLPPRDYLWLLNNAECLVGNSSAGIKECSYLGVPVVDVGTRQSNRLKARNVLNVAPDKNAVKEGIEKQISRGRLSSDNLYHKDKTAERIAHTLATIPLYIQKKFYKQGGLFSR